MIRHLKVFFNWIQKNYLYKNNQKYNFAIKS